MLKIGEFNKLRLERFSPNGAYLEDEENNEVLLPSRYLTDEMKEDAEVEVFIYTDSEDRLIATTEEPKAIIDEFVGLEVVDVNDYGVFLDWGLSKDLFLPYSEQKRKLRRGEKVVVYVYLDEVTNRICASTKFGRYINAEEMYLKVGEEVVVLIYDFHELGAKAIVDQNFLGMIFQNECFQKLQVGQKVKAYIEKIREDNRLDLTLRRIGVDGIIDAKNEVWGQLEKSDGKLFFNAKSSPEEIEEKFNMSKGLFKNAVSMLYKERKISITETGIEINKSEISELAGI